MKRFTTYTILLSSIAILTACGSDSTTTSSTSEGYYVDSAVAGVNYSCGDYNGTTNNIGKFDFQEGKDCIFSLAGIPLRTVSADQLRDNITIVEDNVTIATFLQTLDQDGDAANGIEILPEVVQQLRNDHLEQIPEGDVNLSNMVATFTAISEYEGHMVSQVEANEHLKTTEEAVSKQLLENKKFYIVFDDATGIFTMSVNADATSVTIGSASSSFTLDDTITLDGKTIVWPDGKRSDIEGYVSNYILMVNHYSDGTSNKSYMFATEDEANTFAAELANKAENLVPGTTQLVAPADPSSLDLQSYSTLVFYSNASFTKYNYFANATDKTVSLLTTNVGCMDYGFNSDEKVQDDTISGVATITYFDATQHRTCIESDYANATDANLSGGMKFVVYYNR
jgi:hypothetical protein